MFGQIGCVLGPHTESMSEFRNISTTCPHLFDRLKIDQRGVLACARNFTKYIDPIVNSGNDQPKNLLYKKI